MQMTSVPGSSVLFRLKRDKGLMRDSTQESSRQTFPDTFSRLFYLFQVLESFHTNFRISLSLSLPKKKKKPWCDFDVNALNLFINLRRICIFIMLNLSVHELCFSIFLGLFSPPNSILFFSACRSSHVLLSLYIRILFCLERL